MNYIIHVDGIKHLVICISWSIRYIFVCRENGYFWKLCVYGCLNVSTNQMWGVSFRYPCKYWSSAVLSIYYSWLISYLILILLCLLKNFIDLLSCKASDVQVRGLRCENYGTDFSTVRSVLSVPVLKWLQYQYVLINKVMYLRIHPLLSWIKYFFLCSLESTCCSYLLSCLKKSMGLKHLHWKSCFFIFQQFSDSSQAPWSCTGIKKLFWFYFLFYHEPGRMLKILIMPLISLSRLFWELYCKSAVKCK